jgi:type II secretory pathway component PulF
MELLGAIAVFLLTNPLFYLTVIIFLMAAAQRRAAQRRSLLALVAMVTEKGISLPDAVEAFGRDQGGRFGRRVRQFAGDLRSGMPLAAAAMRNRGVLPHGVEFSARVGAASGKLAPALRDQVTRYLEVGGLRQILVTRVPYTCMVLFLAPPIVAFVMIKIVPSFEKIFADFGMGLPSMTITLIKITHWFVALGGPSLFVLAMLASFASLFWYIGWIESPPPGIKWLFARLDRAKVLRALSYPAESGQPLAPIIERLSIDYPQDWLRVRLLRASKAIAGGAPWIGSLEKQGVIGRVDAAVLLAAERVGNLPWALREMADSNERRLLYRLEVLLQLISVSIVLGFGMATAFFATAMFLPLVKLIWSLAQ